MALCLSKNVPKPNSPAYLVEAEQIVSQILEETSVGAVSQQGVRPPLLQGRLVGHVPDFQVLGLDVVVARVLESNRH